jgi:hypothetical protein
VRRGEESEREKNLFFFFFFRHHHQKKIFFLLAFVCVCACKAKPSRRAHPHSLRERPHTAAAASNRDATPTEKKVAFFSQRKKKKKCSLFARMTVVWALLCARSNAHSVRAIHTHIESRRDSKLNVDRTKLS